MAGPEQAINTVADNVNNLNMNEEDLLQDNGNGIQFQRVNERDQREGGDPIEREQRFIAPEIDNFGGEWDAERVFNPRAASTPHMVLEREPHKQIVTARQLPETGYQHGRGEQAQVRPNPGHMAQNQQRAAAYNQQHQYAHRVGPEPDDDRFYQRAHPATHTAAGPTDVILGPPPRHGHYYQEYQQHYNAPPPNFEHRGGYGRQNHGDEFGGGWTRNQPPPNFRREDQNFAAHQRNWGQAQYHPQRERHHVEYQQPQPIQIGNLEYVLTLDRLPELRGNEGADKVKQFFKKVSSATEGWPEKRRISALEAKVSGRAERALNAALANQPYRFDSIRRAMAAQLEVTDCREMGAFDELMSGLKRKPDESLDALADRIQSLVSRAYPGLTQNLGDEYAIKHLIRALANPELSLSLEMARRPGMSYDDFVALATRAESIQKATKNQNQGNIAEDRNRMAPTNNFRRFQQVRSPNFGQNIREGIVCFNCNEPGHISRECRQPRRQTQFNAEQPQNRPQMATGANNTPMRMTGAEPNRNWQQQSSQNRPAQPRSQNFLKQNCIVAQENVNPNAVCHGVQLGTEIAEFLEKELKKGSSPTNAEGRKSEEVGKILIAKVEVQGTETEAMLDGGAQISLISAQFFYKLIKEGKLDLREVELSRNAARIADVNGKEVKCYGSVTLQIDRKGCQPSNIRFHVTDASFGFNLLLGTNSLADLGFMLYDAANKEMIEFEKVQQQENTLRVIFQTKFRPWSTKLVEVHVGSEWNGKDVVISPISNGSNTRLEQTVGKVADGKVIGQITNLVPSLEQTEEEAVTGTIELAEYIMDADNAMLPTEALDPQSYECGEMEVDKRIETIKAMSKAGRISEPEKSELMNLLSEFEEIFAITEEELRQTDLVSHTIETGDAIPIRSKVRPVPYAYREKVSGMIQDYLGRGIIRPSFSPWASPIVIVPKKDGSLRFCVDYRGLNSVTVKDAFPLPNIDNTLLALGGKKVFTTLDFISGYWQIKMDPQSIDKTAFVTEFGLHEFIVLPFGLSNAVATFQRFMTHLFDGLINDFVFIYIDDILVASESWDKHKEHLSTVFHRIREAGLKLKISKCVFSAGELPFLGHVLTSDGLKMDMDKMRPITEFPTPRSKKALQSFLGFLAYYRKFIYGFGAIAAPLYGLLKKDANFVIGVLEEEAINALKAKIMTDVLLHFPNFEAAKNEPDRKFLMLTDASKIGLGAVLCQPDEKGNIRPIYFASRQCNPHESRYCPTELEALAIRFGAKKFAQFITMLPTRVFTDHKALIYMFKSKTETGNSRVDKWLLELNSRFILQVEYQPGKNNVIADLLSRSPALKCPNSPQENEIFRIGKICEMRVRQAVTNSAENREEWIEKTKTSELGFVYEFLRCKSVPTDPKKQQQLMSALHDYVILDGLLYKCGNDGQTRLFVPTSFREKLVVERHAGACAGHMSGKKVYRQLAELLFWPNMYADCLKVAQKCRICAHTRTPRANEPPLKVVQTTEPLELVSSGPFYKVFGSGPVGIRRRIMAGPEQAINTVADNVNNLNMNEEDLLQDNGEWDAERVFNPRAARPPHSLEREPHKQIVTARQLPETGYQHERGEQAQVGPNPGHMAQNQQRAAAYNQQHQYAHRVGPEPDDDRFYQRGHPATHTAAGPTDVTLGPPPRHGHYYQEYQQQYNAPPPNFEHRGGYGRQNHGDEFGGGWTRNQPPPNFRREDQNFAAHQRGQAQYHPQRERHHAEYQQPQPIQIGNLEYVLTLDRLPELRGNEGADKVKQFFKKVSSATEGWPEKRRISALEAKVSGRAERALNAALANQPYRFDSIRRAMAAQLEVTDCREMGAFDELMSGLKRKPDESLDALADRIQSLVSRAYPGLTQNLGDEYAIKHLIRALANPELSLSLEMARRPDMSYDDFVALATRAESIQKATKNQNQGNVAEDRNRMAPTNNFRRFQQVRSPNFGQNIREGIVCFNCNEPGHISRECRQPRRQTQFNAEQPQNRPQMATGANNTPMRMTGAEPNRNWQQQSSQNRPAQPRSQNFLKQNCIVAQENVNPNAVCHGVQLGTEIAEFLEKELKKGSSPTDAEERKSEQVGKILIAKVEVQGTETEAMLDGGAQISLISAQFFYKLIKEDKLDLREVELSRNAARIADVNGKEVKCYGSVTLQIDRKGCQPSNIRFHVTDASFGFNLLLGTNSLADLGFMLYDAANKEMIEFEKVQQQENTLRVIFQTKFRPWSTKLVEVHVGNEWNGKDVVISPICQEREEGEERMETDNLDNPLSWDTQCGGLGLEHRHCAQLTASDLDPVLEKAGLGLKVVGTPMKAVLASFLLKSSAVSSTAGGQKVGPKVLGTAVGYRDGVS
uniref:RNA-directed DNA polymerase n=1 Tax=Globodera pallida TaxID=36090 RepID=A0A183CJ15_GLOPA